MKLFFIFLLFISVLEAKEFIKVRLFYSHNIKEIEFVPISSGFYLISGSETKKINKKIRVTVKNNLLKIDGKDYLINEKFLIKNNLSHYSKFSLKTEKFSRTYEGELEIFFSNGYIECYLYTNPLYYITSVIASETNATDKIEFKKALALILKNNLDYAIKNNNHINFDFCDNTHCQLFLGDEKITKSDIEAVRYIFDKKVVIENSKGYLYYSGCCGGYTLNPDAIWNANNTTGTNFISVSCDYCKEHKFYNWKNIVPSNKICSLLNFNDKKIENIINEDLFINIITSTDRVRVNKDKLRILYGRKYGWNTILSNKYNFELKKDNIIITGKGFGHNVGLCIEGAKTLAKRGKKYNEILFYYFPYINIYENKN